MRRPAVGRGGGAAVEATLVRLVLLDYEVQEISAKVMSKIRILSAESFDSRSLLTVVLAGDGRLAGQLRSPALAVEEAVRRYVRHARRGLDPPGVGSHNPLTPRALGRGTPMVCYDH